MTLFRIALALFLAAHAHCQAVFRRPPGPGPSQNYLDNPTYLLGDELDIIWEMDYNLTTLVMWNQDAYGNFPQPMSATLLVNTTRLNYTWTISFDNFSSDHDPTLSNVYYFDLSDSEGNLGDTTSHYFNISDPSKVKASSTPTATRIVYREKNVSPSQGAVAGIAIVGTLVFMSMAGVTTFFAWKHFRKPKPSQPVLVHEVPKAQVYVSEMDTSSYWNRELPSDHTGRYEVPG